MKPDRRADSAEVWLSFRTPRPSPELRLLCFPHAGAGASTFHAWSDLLPAEIEVCPIQLPAREDRLDEPAPRRLDELVAELVSALAPELDIASAVFGHSFGAFVAFEVARNLERQGDGPAALIVSGSSPPHLVRRDELFGDRSDAALAAGLRTLGHTPADVLDRPELLSLMLPALRADVAMCDDYRYVPGPPLRCPIIAFVADDDPLATRSDAEAWGEHAEGRVVVETLPGDHLSIVTDGLLPARIGDRLREPLGRA